MKYTNKLFYVFYFHPERNILHSVEIQGLENDSRATRVCAFIDHVEDLNFNIMKTTSICQPEQSTSASSRNDHQVKKTSTSSGKDHQVRTIAHPQQDRRTFESINRFNSLCLLDDDEFT
ncbi:F-box protein [Cardamine amara subsp. amara]|uniref:F-box protein n=1 Tax=Cardamine amara subsp. amara TaxID=228776 RepID=A0ABD1AFT5_CARAN